MQIKQRISSLKNYTYALVIFAVILGTKSYLIGQTGEHEVYYDLFVETADIWKADKKEFTVTPELQSHAREKKPPKFLHAKSRKDRNPGPLVFNVEYPVDGAFTMYVEKVSSASELDVLLDGQLLKTIDLPAGPGKGPWQKFNYLSEYDIYQVTYNKEFSVKIPQGSHTIKLVNKGPDWISFKYFVFNNYSDQNVTPFYSEWKQYSKDISALTERIENYNSIITSLQSSTKFPHTDFTLPTLYLQLENLRRLSRDYDGNELDLMRTEKEIQELLEYVQSGRNYFMEKRGRIKIGYRSDIDGSYQPFDVMIPNKFDSSKSYSLIVYLHGYEDPIQKYRNLLWADEDPGLDNLGAFKVAVYGRRNRYYHGAAEEDVLDVIKNVQQIYPIHKNRIYLSGASMGGFGTWSIGLAYPDLFAGLSPVCGRTHMEGSLLLESASPLNYIENALYLPARIYHGAADLVVSVEYSRNIFKELKKLGYIHKYLEFKDVAHDSWNNASADDQRFSCLMKNRRNPYPDKIIHNTFYLRTGKSYWIDITAKKKWSDFSKVTAVIRDRGVLEIETENVSELKIDTRHPKLLNKNVELIIDGQTMTVLGKRSWRIFHIDQEKKWHAGMFPARKLRKQKYLEGPWIDSERSAFILVYGTSVPERTEQLKTIGQAIQKYYANFDIESGLIPDSAAFTENYKNYNLHLIGTPKENLYLKEITANLPLKMSNDFFAFNKRFKYQTHGIRMIYPNPLKPDRYVLIDIYPEQFNNYNLFQRPIADYLIYSVDKDEIKTIDEGFFNNEWHL